MAARTPRSGAKGRREGRSSMSKKSRVARRRVRQGLEASFPGRRRIGRSTGRGPLGPQRGNRRWSSSRASGVPSLDTGQCRSASGRRSGRNRPAVRGTRPAWSASGEPSPSQSSPPSRSGSPGAFPRRGGTVAPPAGRRPAAPRGRPVPSRRRRVG